MVSSGRDHHQAHFQPHHGNEGERSQDVVGRRDDGGQAEPPLEPDGQVDQHEEERGEYREQRLRAELAAHLRAHRGHLADGVLALAQAWR